MELEINSQIVKVMLAHVQNALPLEACGLLAGFENRISHIYLIDNIMQSSVAYEMDPRQQIEAMLHAEEHGLDLIASYHSHPVGPPAPSPTDVAQAYYPDLAQIIIAPQNREKPSIRAFAINDESVVELETRIVDD